MKKVLFILLGLVFAPIIGLASDEITIREARFHLGDAPEGWMEPGFDDSSWQTIAIPEKWHGEMSYAQYRIRFQLPKDFVKKAAYKKLAIFDLSYIDDCDETFLNGKSIGKSGIMPKDGTPLSAWDAHRVYKVDARELKEGENLLTILVWNRRTRGGIYGNPVRIWMAQLEDLLQISCTDDSDARHCRIGVSSDVCIRTGITIQGLRKNVSVRPGKPFSYRIDYDGSEPIALDVCVQDKRTKQSVQRSFTPKYCLTPEAPAHPRYNGPAVLGAGAGHPIYFRLPFSGSRPMSFSATGLPEGLSLNEETGVMSGAVSEAGEYPIEWEARNAEGIGKGQLTLKVGSGVALTPPMGWNSWNCWGLDISEKKIVASSLALISSGLADYGYCYVNIDDAWQGRSRTEDGTLPPNENFTDIAALGRWLHENGLRLGIYSSPGALTCGGYPGSLGFEKEDADTWNAWGVDYLKYDLCGYRSILDTLSSVTQAHHSKPYILMKEMLERQPRDICYSLCQYGLFDVWTWGQQAGGNLWRTTGDITDTWSSVVRIGFNGQRGHAPYAGPGHWNDPDMLVVGKVGWGEGLRDSRLTADEQYSHVSLWALLAAPLIIGGDLASLDRFTLNLLCNNEVIAVDQDPLGIQAECLYEEGGLQVWGRPLADGAFCAGIFNLSDKDMHVNIQASLEKAGLKACGEIRDLWRQEECPENVRIPSHGVQMLKYYPK